MLRTSQWVKLRAQEAFRKNKSLTDKNRIDKSMSDARKALRALERANQLDLKAVTRLLQLSYGILGQERRKLLQPYIDSTRMSTLSPEKLSAAISHASIATRSSLNDDLASSATTSSRAIASNNTTTIPPSSTSSTSSSVPTTPQISESHLATALLQSIGRHPPAPLHLQNPRTIPPILSPPVVSLIKSATGKNPEPILPVPLFKPLHPKREANLRWRYFVKQIAKVNPPLPSELRQEVEWKSRVGLHSYPTQLGGKEAAKDKTSVVAGKEDLDTSSATVTTHDPLTDLSHRREWEQQILETIRAWNRNGKSQKEQRWATGWPHPTIGGKPARPNTLTPRLYRRIWQHLLDDVPVLDVRVSSPGSRSEPHPNSSGRAKKSVNSTLEQPIHAPSFSVSKSVHSYGSRYREGLSMQATVNSFDRIGLSETTDPAPLKDRNKKSKSRP
ncbi:hypothetical protein BGZ98_000354 [Dissophora globulifera]|nr:hypothetical protein BGZ98_000354 [Dissophora globulifera]